MVVVVVVVSVTHLPARESPYALGEEGVAVLESEPRQAANA